MLSLQSVDNVDEAGLRARMEVNAFGPHRVTAALCRRLPSGGKVAIVTSRMGSLADNTSGGTNGYRVSKAAVNMAGVSLAHDLRDQGVNVLLLHTGYLRTGMMGGNAHVEPAEAAAGVMARIDALGAQNTGSFEHANGDSLPR